MTPTPQRARWADLSTDDDSADVHKDLEIALPVWPSLIGSTPEAKPQDDMGGQAAAEAAQPLPEHPKASPADQCHPSEALSMDDDIGGVHKTLVIAQPARPSLMGPTPDAEPQNDQGGLTAAVAAQTLPEQAKACPTRQCTLSHPLCVCQADDEYVCNACGSDIRTANVFFGCMCDYSICPSCFSRGDGLGIFSDNERPAGPVPSAIDEDTICEAYAKFADAFNQGVRGFTVLIWVAATVFMDAGWPDAKTFAAVDLVGEDLRKIKGVLPGKGSEADTSSDGSDDGSKGSNSSESETALCQLCASDSASCSESDSSDDDVVAAVGAQPGASSGGELAAAEAAQQAPNPPSGGGEQAAASAARQPPKLEGADLIQAGAATFAVYVAEGAGAWSVKVAVSQGNKQEEVHFADVPKMRAGKLASYIAQKFGYDGAAAYLLWLQTKLHVQRLKPVSPMRKALAAHQCVDKLVLVVPLAASQAPEECKRRQKPRGTPK